MSELQEIRRFWPRAKGADGYCGAKVRGVSLSVWATDDYGTPHWEVCVIDGRADVARVRANRWHRLHKDNNPIGPTIAAAMAAAGFAVRKVGKWRGLRLFLEAENRHPWNPEDWKPYKTPLQSRQRPRKGVRLGKRGRRLAPAASLGHAWDWAQRQNDRREAGQ